MNILGPSGIAALERRGIDVEVAARCGLHTVRWDAEAQTAIPDTNGNVVAFPFIENGVVVAEKYRAPQKKFWARKGGRKTFWNADALNDPSLESGSLPLVITEGELDCLSAMTAHFLAVSVPDGAPPPKPPGAEEPIEDVGGKFEFLWNNRDRLRRIKRFIIATDSDAPGQQLAQELVRRLLPARCSFVTYPEGCKDLNDVLVKHGPDETVRVLHAAKPYPVNGIYRLSDYPPTQELETFSTGWQLLDQHLKMFAGEFMVVSGIPSHGKTVWTLNLLAHMAQLHGWKSLIFSPEMPTSQLITRFRKIIGGDADKFINENFMFADADPAGKQDEPNFNLNWLIERAVDAVLRYGIRIFLIDPWNEIEHARDMRENLTDYVGRSIRDLKRFAKQYQVAVIVVAHPTKEVGRDGKMRTPTLYDIESSAHWHNKADHGVIIERSDQMSSESNIWVVKSRFEEAGERGKVRLQYDQSTNRFEIISLPP
jgi:twinkle protein